MTSPGSSSFSCFRGEKSISEKEVSNILRYISSLKSLDRRLTFEVE
jgi:hypothetical protein